MKYYFTWRNNNRLFIYFVCKIFKWNLHRILKDWEKYLTVVELPRVAFLTRIKTFKLTAALKKIKYLKFKNCFKTHGIKHGLTFIIIESRIDAKVVNYYNKKLCNNHEATINALIILNKQKSTIFYFM